VIRTRMPAASLGYCFWNSSEMSAVGHKQPVRAYQANGCFRPGAAVEDTRSRFLESLLDRSLYALFVNIGTHSELVVSSLDGSNFHIHITALVNFSISVGLVRVFPARLHLQRQIPYHPNE
jgi:uncharacterized protein YgbK (DUF1537 family)